MSAGQTNILTLTSKQQRQTQVYSNNSTNCKTSMHTSKQETNLNNSICSDQLRKNEYTDFIPSTGILMHSCNQQSNRQ